VGDIPRAGKTGITGYKACPKRSHIMQVINMIGCGSDKKTCFAINSSSSDILHKTLFKYNPHRNKVFLQRVRRSRGVDGIKLS